METFHIDFRRDIVTEFPSFQFTRDSASISKDGKYLEQSYIDFDSDAGQYKLSPSIMRLQFDIFSYNYFRSNSINVNLEGSGHIFALGRYDKNLTISNNNFFGQGIVLGNVSNFKNPIKNSRGNPLFPSAQAKTWAGIVKDNLISRTSWNEKFQDETQYRIVIDSIITDNNANKVRYQLFQVVGFNKLEFLYDTGQIDAGVLDFNPAATGISFGHVFGNRSSDVWRIEFTNVKVIWGPYLTSDTIPDDPCTCPRNVFAYSNRSELFDFDNSEFKIGFDYGIIEKTPNGTPIYGFNDYATKTDLGYRIQVLETPYCRIPAFLNLGVKFKTPEEVLSRDLRPNVIDYRGYDSWSVGVKGTVTVLHDVIEFAHGGNVLDIDKIIDDRYLNLGITFPPKNINEKALQLDIASFVLFKLTSDKLEKQRTIRKTLFFVFKLDEIKYYLNTGSSVQQEYTVGKNVEVTVNIPIDVGQEDCCGDDISQLPEILPPAVITSNNNESLIFYLNYDVGVKKPVSYIGGTPSVTASITPELPSGLKFNKLTGEITGTPLIVFPPTPFTITFKDSKNEKSSSIFILKVDSGEPT